VQYNVTQYLHSSLNTLPWFKSNVNIILIVSITTFLIVIGSPCTHLLGSQCVIMWVSNYRYPITTCSNWILLIGYLGHWHIKGFLLNISYSVWNLRNALLTFSLKRSSLKILLILKFVIDMISNSNWTKWSAIQGKIARVISKTDEGEAWGRFEITSTISL